MLPLPDFDLLQPRSLAEALDALVTLAAEAQTRDDDGDQSTATTSTSTSTTPSAMLLAGGTDLLPNLKHGLHAPARLISLRRIRELNELRIDPEDGALVIGAGITLARIAVEPIVCARYPALARAAQVVASPQVRATATVGGNICLDTRCIYYNQTTFWRDALGYCIKKDGDVCHVVAGGTRCVAALAADTPAPLCCYGAEVRLLSPRGARVLPLVKFYRADGARHTVREPDEILVDVRLPPPPAGLLSSYVKLRRRRAIDFPQLSIALAVQAHEGHAQSARIVVGALQSRPREITITTPLAGRALDEALARDVATEVGDTVRPLSSVVGCAEWRRRMARVLTCQAFAELAPSRDA